MFHIKSSFILIFVAFYIELSIFEGESNFKTPNFFCTIYYFGASDDDDMFA